MSEPKRIQLRRTKGWRKPEGAIVVARPTVWGNSWTARDIGELYGVGIVAGRAMAAAKFADEWSVVLSSDNDIRHRLGYPESAHIVDIIVDQLGGHDLACWCPLDQPCHADVLLDLANAERS